jgi:hypothetical protein
MAKKKKQSELTLLKSTAQTFTVSAAVLYGVLWLVTMIYDLKSDGLDALGGGLITATVVGGIIMGMIHFADFFKSK